MPNPITSFQTNHPKIFYSIVGVGLLPLTLGPTQLIAPIFFTSALIFYNIFGALSKKQDKEDNKWTSRKVNTLDAMHIYVLLCIPAIGSIFAARTLYRESL